MNFLNEIIKVRWYIMNDNNAHLISIFTPNYNNAKYLKECIDCLIKQTIIYRFYY